MGMRLFYAQSLSQQQITNSGGWDDIAGLSLTLPKQTGDETFALVTLNVPNPYAKGSNYPGCNFTIRVNSGIDQAVPVGCFTSFNKVADPATPISSGRVPVTVVAKVPLDKHKPTAVQGSWQAIRGATAVVDSPCSISAVTGKG
ncbi:MAG TPA: hypothetical protein VF702_13490 [Allosphingosinicella sp.]|jgi:hypothetical protein